VENEVLSISFLPWMLLLLAIILSVPIVGFVESSRRKKELEANRPVDDQPIDGQEVEDGVGEEVAGEGFAEAGTDGVDVGDNAFEGAFDEDAFK
jgi:hypothetical protein